MATSTPELARASGEAPPSFRKRAWLPLTALLALAAMFGMAAALAWATRDAAFRIASIHLGHALADKTWQDIAETVAALVACGLGFFGLRLGSKRLAAAERAVAAFAGHKTRAMICVGLLPMLVRLALDPVLHTPQPLVADEFGYLLLADTFASGRLTNPTHPLWKHFETIYVFHQPTYTSIYPVAPAVPMAAAKALGLAPWLGVWLTAGLMCALICWMLQAWLPPKWAFLGGLLAACRFGITSPWMNTYWGGAMAAAGGALALGAWARIPRGPKVRDSLLFGLGLAILANSRPYEGLLLSLPLALWVGVWLVRAKGTPKHLRVTRVALPLTAAAAVLAAGTAYYNWRVTGHALWMPYSLHQRIYGTPQSFFWQAPITDAPGIHRHKDLADVFHWQLDAYRSQFRWGLQAERLKAFWRFYLQPLFTLPLLFLPLAWKRRRLRVPLLAAGVVLAGNTLYPFFFPHYDAPLAGLLLLAVLEGLRVMRTWRAGRVISRYAVALVFASAGVTILSGLLLPWTVSATFTPRAEALRQLRERGGEHVVLVRYGPAHSFHYGVVYNDANIDASPVVWARDLGAAADAELVRYFPTRDFWLFNPDEEPVKLTPYPGKPYIEAITGGGGWRDDVRQGVSPGGIVTIVGGGFASGLKGAVPAGAVLGRLPVELAEVSATYGDVFSPRAGTAADPPEQLPLALHGVSVWFGDRAARILALCRFGLQEAVTVLVPARLAPGRVKVRLRAGEALVVREVQVLPAAPGIFQMRAAGGGLQAVLLHADGSLVTEERPARRGEELRLFATGLGPQDPPVYGVIVGVHHHGARLISAAGAPGLTGVEEIRFEVPRDAPPGRAVPLAIAAVVEGRSVFGNRSSLPVE